MAFDFNNPRPLTPEEMAAIQRLPAPPHHGGGIPVVGSGALPGANPMGGGNSAGGSGFQWGNGQPGFQWGDVGEGLKSVGGWLAKNPDSILGALAFLEGQKANKRSSELSEAAVQAQQQRMAMSKDAAAEMRKMREGRQVSAMPQDQGNPYTIRRVGRGA